MCAAAHEGEGGLGEPQVEADLETKVEAMERRGEGGCEGVSGFGGAMQVSVVMLYIVATCRIQGGGGGCI